MTKHSSWSMPPGVALAVLLGLFAPTANARTPAMAHSQVRSWVASHPQAFGKAMGSPAGEVLTAANNGTNIFHSVSLSNGGFAVISDSDEALLAFSDRGAFTATNPLSEAKTSTTTTPQETPSAGASQRRWRS